MPRLGLPSRDRLRAAAATGDAAGDALSCTRSHTRVLLGRGRNLLAGTALIATQIVSLAGVHPAWAVCDGNTAGVSVCSGTDAAVAKTATGNLDVQFNNETVTPSGVVISGGAGGFNVDLNVISATGPNPIANTGGDAVNIGSNGGNVAVTTISGANITSTGGAGINSTVTGGSGNTTITFNGNVSGVEGVAAASSSTGSMSVSGSGNASGLQAIVLQNTAAATSGDLTVNTSGNITQGGGIGISAQIMNAANNANISVTHTGTISGSGFGIGATTAGGGNVLVNAPNSITGGGGSIGITAGTATGAITITSGSINTGLQGIDARITGSSSGGITITANGAITSTTNVGIKTVMTGGSGNTTITANADVSGGINSTMTGGSGNTTITFNGNVSGVEGVVAASSSTGSMSVSGAGNVSGLKAIALQNTATATSGDLTVNTSGNITASGTNITAQITDAANNANISVTHTGTISGSGFGISAFTAGGGNVLVNAPNSITGGGGSIGITAGTATGAITITSGSINTGLQGIDARITGSSSGGITITANGAITSTTNVGIKTVMTGGSGNTTITANADVSGTNGIEATAGTGNITVTNAATVAGSSIGVQLTGGTVKAVNNFGAVTGATGISTTTGSSSVFNVGTITGTGGTAVQFAGGGNTLTLAPTSIINGNVLGLGADTFQLGGSGTGSFDASLIGPAQQYRGFGAFTKVSDSVWTLTGTSALVLPWTVQQGTLNVTGTLASSPFTVNNGGTLAGTGTVGDVAVASGGSFAPGPLGTPGAITVAGNLAFQAGGIYLVNLTPATASIANVSGSATLTGGSVQAQMTTGNYIAMSYDILHATGGLGGTTFSGVSVSKPNFSASLSYTPTDVFLNLTAELGTGGSLNGDQQNVTNAINGFFNGGGTLPPGFNTLFGLTGGNLANALSQLSGEAATGAQRGAFQLTSEFLGIMLDPFVYGSGGIGGGSALGFAAGREALPEDVALAYAKAMKAPVYKAARPPLPFEQRWSVWAGGYGGYNHTSGDPAVTGSHDLTAHTAGGAVGLDYHFSSDTVAGFALAGGGTSWDLAHGLGGGRSDAFQAGVYGATRFGPWYLAGAFAFTNHWMSTDRFAAFGDHLTADFNAQSFGGRLEGGYRFATVVGGVTPYAAVQAQSFRTPSYTETDVTGGGFALSYSGHTGSDTRSELGARFDHAAVVGPDAVLILRGRLAWAHDWITDPTLTPVFQVLPGASFIVNGAVPAENSALVSAGAELRLANGVSMLAKFDGDFANHSQTYAGTGTLRYRW